MWGSQILKKQNNKKTQPRLAEWSTTQCRVQENSKSFRSDKLITIKVNCSSRGTDYKEQPELIRLLEQWKRRQWLQDGELNPFAQSPVLGVVYNITIHSVMQKKKVKFGTTPMCGWMQEEDFMFLHHVPQQDI